MSDLKIVNQRSWPRNGSAKREEQQKREDSWKLIRQEIAGRVRQIRSLLEKHRDQLEGMTFDVVNIDSPSNDYPDTSWPLDFAEAFNPCISGLYKRVEDSTPADLNDDLVKLKVQTAESAFQIGVLAGAIFAGCTDREIDRLERGLVHATVSRSSRVKR